MSNKSLKALLAKQAKEDDGSGGARWTPPDGSKLVFKIVKVNFRSTEDKPVEWGVYLEVTKGEHQGKKFWANLTVNTKHAFITNRTVDNFKALGINLMAYIDTPEVVRPMLEGKTGVAVVQVRAGTRPGSSFVNVFFEAARKAKTDDEDFEDDYDDGDDEDWEEEKPKKKKKKKKKAKPAPVEDDDDDDEDEWD